MKKLIFLGGTVGNNKWRKSFIEELRNGGIKENYIFDPVVDDWNEEAQNKEEVAKKIASHMVFYLGSPKQEGNPLPSYSMVEATMSLYDKPKNTILIFDEANITGQFLKSYKQAQKVLKNRFPKSNIFSSLKDAVNLLIKDLKDSK